MDATENDCNDPYCIPLRRKVMDRMQPIFPEYVQFLKDNGCAVDWFKEETFWLDNNIVKAFRRGGASSFLISN